VTLVDGEALTLGPGVLHTWYDGVQQIAVYVDDAGVHTVEVPEYETPGLVPPPSGVELPIDFIYREVAEIDLDDAVAVAAFCAQWGLPSSGSSGSPGRHWKSDLAVQTVDAAHLRGLDQTMQAMEQRAPMLALFGVPLDAVRLQLRALRALAAHWEAANLGQDQAIVEAWHHEGLAPPMYPTHAWWRFQDVLNAGLARMAVRIDVEGNPARPPGWNWFNGACLQLANQIVEGLPLQRCANETCSRLFTRQRDRAEQGQYRTSGVLYCSNSCARAQAQRAYRRRQRAQSPS
jgi:hypothetical protein